MNKLAFIAIPALLLLAGCGGSGSPAVVAPVTPYAGSYASNLTSPAGSALLVILQSNGSATAVVADPTGILATGTGTVSGNTLTINAAGSAGNINVSTTFPSAKTAVSQITGAVTDSNLSDTLVASAGQSPFAGYFNVTVAGASSGTGNFTITPAGGISGSGTVTGGSTVTFSGTSQLTDSISFTGTVLAKGTETVSYAGSLYLTNVNKSVGPTVYGSGTWSVPGGQSGTWSAQNVLG
ncbi:MAG TPA: hypothetical protein VGL56_06500 [Fimbriimonadaceae bacterium]|jgi:fibronectin-binding autotransporter adhesin